ncbi:MAG: hypothetical protein J1F32_03870 [Erysipelotrichales bacterium]|nr:hypothetical protein [Erysipelotrichales bacterium]
MDKLKNYYFALCDLKRNSTEFSVLLIINGKCAIINAKDEIELCSMLYYYYNQTNLTDIYISNKLSLDTLISIHRLIDATIHISPINQYNLEWIKYEENFLKPNDINNILETEKAFEIFFNENFQSQKEEEIIKKLKKYYILQGNKSDIRLSNIGNILFSSNYEFDRDIIVENLYFNNALSYTLEHHFSGPITLSAKNIVNYLYDKMPFFQERIHLKSKSYKPINKTQLNDLIYYCLCMNDYTKNYPIEIKLLPVSISISFRETNSIIWKKVYNNFFSSQQINNICEYFKKNKFYVEQSIKKDKTTIKILYNENINKFYPDLDVIDYEIIQLAQNHENFTRHMVDKFLDISPRNSNIRLKKIIEKGIISADGNGKAIKYYLSHKK